MFNKLRGRIKEVFHTDGAFAIAMELNPASLSLRLQGKLRWTDGEIARACELLNIPVEEIHIFFFNQKV